MRPHTLHILPQSKSPMRRAREEGHKERGAEFSTDHCKQAVRLSRRLDTQSPSHPSTTQLTLCILVSAVKAGIQFPTDIHWPSMSDFQVFGGCWNQSKFAWESHRSCCVVLRRHWPIRLRQLAPQPVWPTNNNHP